MSRKAERNKQAQKARPNYLTAGHQLRKPLASVHRLAATCDKCVASHEHVGDKHDT